MYVDEGGLPYSDYGTYNGIDIGRQRSILSVAERGLWCWNQFDFGADKVLLSYDWNKWPVNREQNPTDSSEALTVFRSCSDWMLNEIQDKDNFAVWVYPYPMSYGTASGWRSAHAQATGLQLLVRAARLLKRPEFLKPVDRLLSAFDVAVDAGGLLDTSEAGLPWFEKFADPNNRKPKVLNGLLFAILGLRDVHRYTGSSHALDLADTGLESALALMPRFDLGDWSAYDIEGKRASPHYHNIHIRQMAQLSKETSDQRVLGWHDRFVEYREIANSNAGKLKLPWKSGQPAGDNYHDRLARNYLAQRVHQPIWQAEHKAVAYFLDQFPPDQSVLDVPFGTGRFVPLYLEHDMAVTGVDISDDMLAEARRALGPLSEAVCMLRADAADLPFDNNSFDGLVSMRFLETIIPYAMVRPVLTEFRRVCRTWAIVRLNSRAAELPPLASPPDGAGIMGTALHVGQLQALCAECGWQLGESVVVGCKSGTMKGEQRVCLLRAIN